MKRPETSQTAPHAALAILTPALVAGLASLGTSIANIALPALTAAFEAPFAHVQGVVVAYLGALTLSVLLAGWLGDRIAIRRMLLLGVMLFAGASLLCSFAPNLWLLVLARIIQGVGAAFMMTLSMAMMRQTAGEARLGQAMGLMGTASAVGTALGPSLGGLLLPAFGWRGIFGVLAPMAVVVFVLAWSILPGDRSERGPSQASLRSSLNPELSAMLLSNALVASVMMTTLVVGPFYLGGGLGLNAVTVGLIMTVGPAISIVSGIPSGRLVDYLGGGRVLLIGASLLAAGTFLLAVLPDMAGAANYIAAMVLLTPGYQLFQAANNTAAMKDVPRERRGTLSGLLNLSRNIGLISGAVIMGGLFAQASGTQSLSVAEPSAIAAGMRLTFSLAGAMMVAVVVINRKAG